MRLYEIFHDLQTLYVCRPLTNAEELIAWATEQGFRTCIPAKNLHCTIAYSTKKVDWNTSEPLENTLKVSGGKRKLSQFGDAVVLQFEDESLHDRWKEFIDEVGCSWDHEDYNPHVTLTFENPGIDIRKIKPYDGELVFGPEKFSEVDGDFQENFKEIKLNESMTLGELDADQAYEIFKKSYSETTNAAWDKDKFLSRARSWTFYGDNRGFLAVRSQRSGPKN